MGWLDSLVKSFNDDIEKYEADMNAAFEEFKIEMGKIVMENSARIAKEAAYEYYFEYAPQDYVRKWTLYNMCTITPTSTTKFKMDFYIENTNAGPVHHQTWYAGWHGGPMRGSKYPIYVGIPIDQIINEKIEEYNALEYTKYAYPLAHKLLGDVSFG